MEKIILWIVSAWKTFSDWVETQPTPNIDGARHTLANCFFAILVLAILLIIFWRWSIKAAAPYIREDEKSTRENANYNRKLEEETRKANQTNHTPGVVKDIQDGKMDDWQ